MCSDHFFVWKLFIIGRTDEINHSVKTTFKIHTFYQWGTIGGQIWPRYENKLDWEMKCNGISRKKSRKSGRLFRWVLCAVEEVRRGIWSVIAWASGNFWLGKFCCRDDCVNIQQWLKCFWLEPDILSNSDANLHFTPQKKLSPVV